MGMVYLVGAGPGDPDLITVRGKELLKQCDALIYDRLGTNQLLEYVKESCEKIYVGKQAGAHYKKQSEINEILVETAKKYEMVVRLKGGDPFVFGRGGEEALVLQENGIAFQVIPGITSAIAVPEMQGIPVTHREVARSFQVITGHTISNDPAPIENVGGTSIFLMGLAHLDQIVQKLLEKGASDKTPVAVIANGTLPGEQIVRGTLQTIVSQVKQAQLPTPAIIVVGQTAEYECISKNAGLLQGRHIGVVATPVLQDKLKYSMQQYGAKVYPLCNMKVEKTRQWDLLKESVSKIEAYTWIGFTSQNAITLFFEALRQCRIDQRRLARMHFAVVGSGTRQALEQQGYQADCIPEAYTTQAMAHKLTEVLQDGDRLLLPRAAQGSREMIEILEQGNIAFDMIPIYDVVGKHTENVQYLQKLDCLVFVSASGVHAFLEGKEELAEQIRQGAVSIACLGEVTAKALERYGLKADILPQMNDVDGLIQATTQRLGRRL